MARLPGISYRQSLFLRALRNPAGLSPTDWPAPAVVSRWLRRPRFLTALESALKAIRYQSEYQLATAALRATAQLAASPEISAHSEPADPESTQSKIKNQKSEIPLDSLLRLAHASHRFSAAESRHTTTQTLTAELAAAQSELAKVRDELADAKQQLLLSVPLDPYVGDMDDEPTGPDASFAASPPPQDNADPNPPAPSENSM
jgi:hypothetical protein